MNPYELRDREQARQFLLRGLWLQRVLPPTAATVRPALEWALEVASGGQPLPPLGFIADLGHLAFGLDSEGRFGREAVAVPGLPAGLIRTYEDHVLGKIYADGTFERAGYALRQYQGRDRARGLSFVLNQLRERAGFDGVLLSPAIIKGLMDISAEELLGQGWEGWSRGDPQPLLPQMYESIIATVRRLAEVLGPEDLFELEHRTALAELGQRVALRQVLQAAERLAAGLPLQRVRPPALRQDVPTRVFDEDVYPVGGYAALANRGSIESLLHSQLAYMEKSDRPDLFDIKFLRDELLYYARDENQFRRRRRTFLFMLWPDLVQTRFKDAELPWQRGVLLLALLVVAVRKLSEWLSTDALHFQFLFLDEGQTETLAQERALIEMLLREAIANGTVEWLKLSPANLDSHCTGLARRSLCYGLSISTSDLRFESDETMVTRLLIDGPRPMLDSVDEALTSPEASEPLESWSKTLERLLQVWV